MMGTDRRRVRVQIFRGRNRCSVASLIGQFTEDMLDPQQNVGDSALEGGVNAYVAAIKGRDVARRGQRGKIKFSNKRKEDDGDEMEIDEEEVAGSMKKLQVKGRSRGGRGRLRGG